jgi:hypothetical protein
MTFLIIRTDDHGHCYLVDDYLTSDNAKLIYDELVSLNHKQFYEIFSWENEQDRTNLFDNRKIIR